MVRAQRGIQRLADLNRDHSCNQLIAESLEGLAQADEQINETAGDRNSRGAERMKTLGKAAHPAFKLDIGDWKVIAHSAEFEDGPKLARTSVILGYAPAERLAGNQRQRGGARLFFREAVRFLAGPAS